MFKYNLQSLLIQSLEKRNLYLKKEVIDGTIHCKPGAAELLVLEVYTILSKGRYVGSFISDVIFIYKNKCLRFFVYGTTNVDPEQYYCNSHKYLLSSQSDVTKNHNIYCVSRLRVSDVESPEPDFTDEEYQNLLPSLARSTASKAIKNNLTATEIKAVPDISTNQRKAENILRRHLEHKAAERILNPGRSSMIK